MYVYVYMCVCVCVHACMLSHFSHVQLFASLWTVACQAPVSMEFSRKAYWDGLPCPPPGDLPDPGVKFMSPEAPALQVNSLPLHHQRSPYTCVYICTCIYSFAKFRVSWQMKKTDR